METMKISSLNRSPYEEVAADWLMLSVAYVAATESRLTDAQLAAATLSIRMREVHVLAKHGWTVAEFDAESMRRVAAAGEVLEDLPKAEFN